MCHAPSWKQTVWRQELSSIIIKSRKDILSSPPCSSAGINLHLLAKDKGQRDCLQLQVISHCQKITLNFVTPAIPSDPLLSCIWEGRKPTGPARKTLPVPASVEGGEEKARRTPFVIPKESRDIETTQPTAQYSWRCCQPSFLSRREGKTPYPSPKTTQPLGSRHIPHNPLLNKEAPPVGSRSPAALAKPHSSEGAAERVWVLSSSSPDQLAASAEGQQATDEGHSSNKHCSNST